MPPIRSQRSKDLTEQEGRLLLAIEAFKNKEISSIREVARRFSIPETTLRRRLNSIQNRAYSRPNSSKLTLTKEESPKKWILSIDLRRSTPRPSIVREIADLLLKKRRTTLVPSVGEN